MATELRPMAATLAREPFDDPGFIFERKLDGIRYLAFVKDGAARLVTRNGLTHPHPAVEAALLAQPRGDFVVDGEMVASVGERSGFGLRGDPRATVEFHVFDVLRLDGKDVTGLPLEERKKLLEERFSWRSPVALVRPLGLRGVQAHERACAQGWEGIVAKRRDSVYEPGARSKAWLKVKCDASQELVVGGFLATSSAIHGFRSLLLGVYDGGDLRFAGKVSGGGTLAMRRALRERLGSLEIDEPPFVEKRGLPRKDAHWVRPEIVVQVAFTEWTESGKLRHPRMLGVREDKRARDVVRES